jgi:hypothetical protein
MKRAVLRVEGQPAFRSAAASRLPLPLRRIPAAGDGLRKMLQMRLVYIQALLFIGHGNATSHAIISSAYFSQKRRDYAAKAVKEKYLTAWNGRTIMAAMN